MDDLGDQTREEDHLELQQEIQQIHRVLGESIDGEEDEDASSDDEDEDDDSDDDEDVLVMDLDKNERILRSVAQLQKKVSIFKISIEVSPATSRPLEVPAEPPRDLEPTAENLLQLNLSYQDQLCSVLDLIKEVRQKNHITQKKVSEKTRSLIKGTRPMLHFQKHYFSGERMQTAPLSDEAKQIKAHEIQNPFVGQLRTWTEEEDTSLYEGVRNDGLQRCMQPLMARQELLFEKRQAAEEEEKRTLTKEINSIIEKLEEMNTTAKEEELLGDRLRDVDWLKISSLHLNGLRTSVECQLRWQNHLHPSVTNGPWSVEEERRLDEIVEEHQGRDWKTIAEKLGTNRAAFQCFTKYQEREILAYTRRPFTREEDALLTELVRRFRIGSQIHFNKVAYFMDQRDRRKIHERWIKKLDPRCRSGFWTREEDECLRKGLEQHGLKWYKVAQEVEGRSSAQCRDRWLYTLNPGNRKGRYTLKEDLILLESVKQYGVGCWVQAARALSQFCTRTPNSVLHRFNNMFQNFFKNVKGISLREGTSFDLLREMPLEKILDEMLEYRKSQGERKNSEKVDKKYQELYKSRRARTLPSPMGRKNDGRRCVQNVDEKLLAALKPIGWANPTPGACKKYAASKKKQRQELRERILEIIMKALAINMEGRDDVIASMANREGVSLKSKSKAKSASSSKGKSSSGTKSAVVHCKEEEEDDDEGDDECTILDQLMNNDNLFSDVWKNQSDESKKQTEKGPLESGPAESGPPTRSAPKLEKVDCMPTVSAVINRPKTVRMKLEHRRTERAFGKGAISVPGQGYLVPLNNYLNQFGVPRSPFLSTMHAPTSTSVQAPLVQGLTQTEGLTGKTVLQNIAPSQIHSGLAGLGAQVGPQMSARNVLNQPGVIHLPGKGYLIPISKVSQLAGSVTGDAVPPSVMLGQTFQGVAPATNVTNPISVTSQASIHASLEQTNLSLASNVPGNDPVVTQTAVSEAVSDIPSSPAKGVVHVTVLRDKDTMKFCVEEQGRAGKHSITKAATSSTTTATESSGNSSKSAAFSESSSDAPLSMDQQSLCAEQEVETQSGQNVPLCKPGSAPLATGRTLLSESETTSNSRQRECDSNSESKIQLLPPNAATTAAFMTMLLERKRLESNAKRTQSFQSVRRKPFQAGDKGVLRGPGGLLQELSSMHSEQQSNHATPNGSGMIQNSSEVTESSQSIEGSNLPAVLDSNSLEPDASICSEELEVDGTREQGSQNHQEQNNTKAARKKGGRTHSGRNTEKCVLKFERTSAEHSQALEVIHQSEWFHVFRERFLSLFLWPAMLSIVGPHRKRAFIPKAKPAESRGESGEPAAAPTAGDIECDVGNQSESSPAVKHGRRKKRKRNNPNRPSLVKSEGKSAKRKLKSIHPVLEACVARRTRSSARDDGATGNRDVSAASSSKKVDPKGCNPSPVREMCEGVDSAGYVHLEGSAVGDSVSQTGVHGDQEKGGTVDQSFSVPGSLESSTETTEDELCIVKRPLDGADSIESMPKRMRLNPNE
ncbi:uncharacterized protein [Diadema setosum]|uniref:uncharacterized protein n=1 Tax=Diadema setosum TaxID=31175 RepID=UPI003B3A2F61